MILYNWQDLIMPKSILTALKDYLNKEDVFNDLNGIGSIQEDDEYHYVFLNYTPGYCGGSPWMIDKENGQVSRTNMSTLIICDVIDRLKDVLLNDFKRRIS